MNNMTSTISNLPVSLLRKLITGIKNNEVVRSLVYDDENVDGFTNLLEHEKMLGDKVRVDNYYEAIRRNILSGDSVIDLGTGTGILSFFAAQQDPKIVYAIDHSKFIKIAEQIAQRNNIDCIDFISANSREFVPPEPVDVILHEQIGDCLLNENMVENLLDLKRRALKKGGMILPGKFELYLEPVNLKADHRVPYIWEKNIHNVDFQYLKYNAESDKYKLKKKYDRRFLHDQEVNTFLCKQEPILSFDLNAMENKDEIANDLHFVKTVEHAGELNGLCMYFRVIFDEAVSFDTKPLNTNTHWNNLLFRTESKQLSAGDRISGRLHMGDIARSETWSVDLS